MANLPPAQSAPSGAPATHPAIQIVQTVPSKIAMHTIEDHLLDKLTNVSRPIPLAIAGVAAGGILGLLPTLRQAAPAIGTAQFSGGDLLFVALASMLVPIAIYCGWIAYEGEREARRLVAEIRARAEREM